MKSALIAHDFSLRLLRDDYSHPTRLQTRNDELPRTKLLGLCEAKARMCTHRNRHTQIHTLFGLASSTLESDKR